MENALNKRPWLVPVVLAILTIILFRPVILPPEAGQVLDSHDLVNMFYPLQEFIRQSVRAGKLPLWNPYLFLGIPNIANPHASLFYPATWFIWLVGTQRGIGLMMVLHTWLGAWGMARLARRFGATYAGALLAGVVYAMSGWTAARYFAGHYNLYLVFGWIPWILAAYHHALQRESWAALWPGVGLVGVAFLAGYTPLMVYLGLALAVMWAYYTLPDDNPLQAGWRAGWRLTAMLGGGAILAAALLLPTAQLSRYAIRDANDLDFALQHALPPVQYLSALLLPDLVGNPNVEPSLYWGEYFFEEDVAYAGLLPLLAIALTLRWTRRESWYFMGLVGLGLVLSSGIEGALFPLLIRWIPGFGFFRVPARALLLVLIGMSGLTGLLVTELQTRSLEERSAALRPALRTWLPVGIVLGFGLTVFFAGWYASASHVEPMPHRAMQIANTLAEASLIACAVWFALWLWIRPDTGAIRWALGVTALVIVLDAWHIIIPLVTFDQVPEAPVWTGARGNIPTGTPDRVLMVMPLTGPINTAIVAGYPHVNGYDPLPIDAFDKLATLSDSYDPTARINTLFGVNYVLSAEPFDDEQFELIGIAYDHFYYKRTNPVPRVWFPGEIVIEPDDAAVRRELVRPRTNPLVTAFVERDPGCEPGSGSATITEYDLNKVVIQAKGEGGVLILSDQYYPGWRAKVDGSDVEIVRADTVFRAVCVPPGLHTVTFDYRPRSFYAGVIISAAAWILWAVAGVIVGISIWRRARRAAQPPEAHDT